MRVWRITSKKFQRFDGEGASLRDGRWNHRGTAVVYVSSSLSLAALELFVNVETSFAPTDLVSVPADIPESVRIKHIEVSQLPKDWHAHPPPESLRDIGATWVAEGASAVFSVPSALITLERNFLLNPKHKDFKLIQIGKPLAFRFDPRMWKS